MFLVKFRASDISIDLKYAWNHIHVYTVPAAQELIHEFVWLKCFIQIFVNGLLDWVLYVPLNKDDKMISKLTARMLYVPLKCVTHMTSWLLGVELL